MRCFVPLFGLLLLASPAAARNVYVNNTGGDDRSTGKQPQIMADVSGPVQTIAKALRLAQAGDHIVLAETGQPYRESISLVGSRHSGYANHPLVIEGRGAVLDGSAPVPADAWKNYRDAVFRFRPPHTGSQQLFLDGQPAVRVAGKASSASPPALEPKQWCLHDGHIYFCVEPTKLPSDYRLTFAALQTGITLDHVEGVGIQDLTVQGYQLDGINVHNSGRKVYLKGVTSRANGRAGVVVGGASQVELDGCRVLWNGQAQLLTQPYSETHLWSSDLASDTARAWLDQGGKVWLGDTLITGGREQIKADEAHRKPDGGKAKPGDKEGEAKPEEGKLEEVKPEAKEEK